MKDNVMQNGKWEFNKEVADCFEDMLTRSIPQYDIMREAVANLVYDCILLQESSDIYNFDILDIGCSDGLMIEKLLNKYKEINNQTLYGFNGSYVGVDSSEPMLEKAKERFKEEINEGTVNLYNYDLKTDFPCRYTFDVITSILCVQFIPLEYRQQLIQNIYNNLVNGGSFIMVEKVLGSSNDINNLFVKNYYNMKRQNGYTREQIKNKRTSLEGVLTSLTNNWNIELLKQAGFKQVDVFWRWMNFVGYIAIK